MTAKLNGHSHSLNSQQFSSLQRLSPGSLKTQGAQQLSPVLAMRLSSKMTTTDYRTKNLLHWLGSQPFPTVTTTCCRDFTATVHAPSGHPPACHSLQLQVPGAGWVACEGWLSGVGQEGREQWQAEKGLGPFIPGMNAHSWAGALRSPPGARVLQQRSRHRAP